LRDLRLTTGADGTALNVESEQAPYVLAGTTHRWAITSGSLAVGSIVHLTAHGVTRDIVQDVPVVAEHP
jgi:hypothetical protein